MEQIVPSTAPGFVLFLLLGMTGSGLALFLAILFLRKSPQQLGDRLAMCALLSVFLWHMLNANLAFQWLINEYAGPEIQQISVAAEISKLFAVAFVVHLVMVWAKLHWIWGLPVYAAVIALAVAPRLWDVRAWYVIAAVATVVAGSLWNASHAARAPQRRFHRVFAIVITLVAVSAFLPVSFPVEITSVLAMGLLLWFVHRANVLDLVIERRAFVVIGLALLSTIYLAIVLILESEISMSGSFGPMVRFPLIIAAGALWLPLFTMLSRMVTSRAQAYMDKARRVLESADQVLNLQDRVSFLCQSITREFGLRRAYLVVMEPFPAEAAVTKGEDAHLPPLETLLPYVRDQRPTFLKERRVKDAAVRTALRQSGYRYALPLWLQEEVIGFFFLDPDPRVSTEDLDSVLSTLAHEIAHSVAACRLIDEKIGLEKSLVRQEHLAGLGKLTAQIAHEVKNPLSSIHALAQLMSEDPAVMENYERDIQFIASETQRLAANVQQLLAYARPVAAKASEARVYQIIDTVATTLAREHAPRQIEVRKQVDEALQHLVIRGDLFQQILLNLALNAIQFSSPGNTVDITACLDSTGHCHLDVTDEGPGIPAEMQTKVFEPFFTTREKGTGLGLATVRKNIIELGGTIEIVSPVLDGHGTRFHVTVPVHPMEQVAA